LALADARNRITHDTRRFEACQLKIAAQQCPGSRIGSFAMRRARARPGRANLPFPRRRGRR
jgi:hypothetical protein